MEKFKPEHLWQIELQDAQRSWYDYASVEYAQSLADGLAYTGRMRGCILVCGGVIDTGPEVGHLWCFLSRQARHHFLRLHRTTLRFMQLTGKRRLIATAEAHFADGCRWLEMLGFERGELLPNAGPDGCDHIKYEKVN